jgi:hypothetical protein
MYTWVGPVLGIIGVVLVLGLLLKDASGFNTLLGGINSTIGTLENAGGNSGISLPSISSPVP